MKKFFGFLLSLICLLNFSTSVDAANDYISAQKSTNRMEYIDNLEIYHNLAGVYDLYILDDDTYFSSKMNLRYPEEANYGFTYIIGEDNLTSNEDKNYYIKQVAILWYEDYLNGTNSNISSSMKQYISNNTDDIICYYIVNLVNNAKNYSNDDVSIRFDDDNVSFYKSGSYYYSNEITFTANDLSANPTISLSGAPTGASIVDKDLRKNGTNSFKIKLSSTSMNNFDDDFDVIIKGKSSNKTTYIYSNGNYEGILGLVYNSSSNTISDTLTVYPDYSDFEDDSYGYNTNVRIKVLNDNGKYISGIKYYVYEGNCMNYTCSESDYVTQFTTTSTYYTLKNKLDSGTYTFVRKTNTSYDLREKNIIEVLDTSSIQTFTFEEGYEYEDEYYNKTINIQNTINDSSVIIKIYKNNGTLLKSYRSNNTDYEVELSDGMYYIEVSDNSLEVYFKIQNGELYIKEGSIYNKRNLINLDNYYNRYTTNLEDDKSNTNKEDVYYQDEEGTIHIDNLDGVSGIDISQKVDTTTDVKVDWLSNIIDCPQTMVSSTIKYIIGAIIAALGIFLTVKNVKKSKNNI